MPDYVHKRFQENKKRWAAMKKSLFTVTMLMLLLVPLAGRVAAEKVEVYTGAVNDIKVEGHSSMPADKPILLYRNITYVPFRYMGGVLGKQVDWDSERRVISYRGEIPAVVSSSQPEIGRAHV